MSNMDGASNFGDGMGGMPPGMGGMPGMEGMGGESEEMKCFFVVLFPNSRKH